MIYLAKCNRVFRFSHPGDTFTRDDGVVSWIRYVNRCIARFINSFGWFTENLTAKFSWFFEPRQREKSRTTSGLTPLCGKKKMIVIIIIIRNFTRHSCNKGCIRFFSYFFRVFFHNVMLLSFSPAVNQRVTLYLNFFSLKLTLPCIFHF